MYRPLSLFIWHRLGGKLKLSQIALLRIAKKRSFVPVDSAELGITDKILTKINTQESVSKVWKIRSVHLYGNSAHSSPDPEHFHERSTADLPLSKTSH